MKKTSGMSLVEVVIVMAIIAIIAGVGLMNGRQVSQKQSARSAVATFQQSIWQGATAAAARGLTVELHRTAKGLVLRDVATGGVIREYEMPAEVTVNADNPILRFTPPGKVDLATLDRLPDELIIDTGYGAFAVDISLIGEVRAKEVD